MIVSVCDNRIKTASLCADGKISAILLIVQTDFSDLPTLLTWIDSLDVRGGILLLYNITSRAGGDVLLPEFTRRGFDIKDYTTPVPGPIETDPHLVPVTKAFFHTKLKNMIPMNAVIEAIDITGKVFKKLYINGNKSLDMSGLKQDAPFNAMLAKYGCTEVIYSDTLLQGGDMLWVRDRLLLGRSSRDVFSPHAHSIVEAEANIRHYYQFEKEDKIDWLITENTALYHLDIWLTYTGTNKNGNEQFFIAYMPDEDPIAYPDVAREIRAELANLYIQVSAFLESIMPDGGYELTRIPIFRGYHFISPLNGITDCVKGAPLYYFPDPLGISVMSTPHDRGLIARTVQEAYDTMVQKINVRRVPVPMGFLNAGATGGGQSLHCSIAVLERAAPIPPLQQLPAC